MMARSGDSLIIFDVKRYGLLFLAGHPQILPAPNYIDHDKLPDTSGRRALGASGCFSNNNDKEN